MNGHSGAVLEISAFVLILAGAIGFGAYLGERNVRSWGCGSRLLGGLPAQRQKRVGPGDERQVTPVSGGGSPSACDKAAALPEDPPRGAATGRAAADDLDDWFRDLWWTR